MRNFAEKDKQIYLVLIDLHLKWIEVFPVTSTTSTKTIECLRLCFATYGVPEQLVSDNGPQFTSDEFRQFVNTNGIKHTLVPAYHPSSNGAFNADTETKSGKNRCLRGYMVL